MAFAARRISSPVTGPVVPVGDAGTTQANPRRVATTTSSTGAKTVASPAYPVPDINIPYDQINTQAAAASSQGLAALQAAQSQREIAAQAAGGREQHLTNYLAGLAQAEQERLQGREQQVQSGLEQSLKERGLYNQGAVSSVSQGIGATYGQADDLMRERQQREMMSYRAALSGQTLGARGEALRGQFDTAQQAMAMRQFPSQTAMSGEELQAAVRAAQREVGVGSAKVQGQHALTQAQLAEEAHRRSAARALGFLDMHQTSGLSYANLQSQLALAGVGGVGPRSTTSMYTLGY